MAKTYSDMMAQIHALQAEAEKVRKKEVADVIKRIREAIDFYGLTSADLGFTLPRGVRRAGVRSKASAEAKYGDGQGNVWGGRGPRPAWLRDALAQGRTLEEFAVGGSGSGASADSKPAKKSRKAAVASKGGAGLASKRRQAAAAPRRKRVAASPDSQVQSQPPQEVSEG